ncbi:hypothetical protein GCM10008023_15930 [Sphingomonas glacialis]|uniref:Uncharacterized protein n=1 Tax=Sphingomonas glacialis TaxID=658225 RepID=A0ABQ3LPE3_9SPHN|nr:hypothetical protein [Sphingomonas glacialis]GHH14335.1 hypothetical protein GCM10008023_15930 [Sphingomonas glacialis]
MTDQSPNPDPAWLDPADDAPEWTGEILDTAEFAIGGTVSRPATGYLGPNGVMRGRPPERGAARRSGE